MPLRWSMVQTVGITEGSPYNSLESFYKELPYVHYCKKKMSTVKLEHHKKIFHIK